MTTWSEIIELKIDRLASEIEAVKMVNSKKKRNRNILYFVLFLLGLIALGQIL